MKVTITNGVLHVEIPVNTPLTPSASGKTMAVASSKGNKTTEVIVEGQPLVVGLNAYIKR